LPGVQLTTSFDLIWIVDFGHEFCYTILSQSFDHTSQVISKVNVIVNQYFPSTIWTLYSTNNSWHDIR